MDELEQQLAGLRASNAALKAEVIHLQGLAAQKDARIQALEAEKAAGFPEDAPVGPQIVDGVEVPP